MRDGSWTIEPCEYAEAKALADALELGEVTASILVRRGYADVEEARALLRGEIEPHDPFLLGDMAVAVERIRAAIAAGKRICVHGDYDVDGICATALAVLTLRELGADVEWHLPSRFEEGYGVSGDTISRLADEGCALVLTVDCGITAVEEVAAAKARGLEVIVTDHHRPGRRAAGLPDRRDPAVRLSRSRSSAARASSTSSPRRSSASTSGAAPRPRRARDDRRRRAAPGREPLARDRRPARARAHPAPGPAGADAERPRRSGRGRRRRRRLPARAADQRRRPARPARRRARAAAHRRRRRGQAPRRRARDAEPRPPGRRGPDPARGRRRGRVVARDAPPPTRLRDLGRGLARRRDRDRRLAPRRALQPAGRPDRRRRRRLEGLGPLDCRRSTCTARSARARSTWSASAATAPLPASRSSPPTSRRSRPRSPRTPTPCSTTTTSRP